MKSFGLQATIGRLGIHPYRERGPGGWHPRDGYGSRPGPPATRRALSAGSIDHVMVIGIAGGLDPALPVGSLMVPERVQLYPDGPVFPTHPIASRQASGGLMTTDGLFDNDESGAHPRKRLRRRRHGSSRRGRGVRGDRRRLVGLSGHQRSAR